MAADDPITLPDISDDQPAGEDLEYDPEFGELDRAATEKPEVQYGDTIQPGEPPDWREMQRIGQSLLERTRDLRVLAHLAVARLHQQGLPAYAEVLSMIRHQLAERWEHVHPQLDPEDPDPMMRANTTLRLADPKWVLGYLRDMPLARSPQTGPISWRDIQIFRGAIDPDEGKDKPSEALIRGAFARTDQDRLAVLREAVDRANLEVAAIPAAFDAAAGYGTGPDFTPLAKILRDMQKEMKNFEPSDEPVEEAGDEGASDASHEESGGGYDGGGGGGGGGRARGGFASIKQLSALPSRDEALYALELACNYFRTNEPSSPLPMLIERAMRLSQMDFLSILQDIAPDGLMQAQQVAGPRPDM